jgi:hypothetical protein
MWCFNTVTWNHTVAAIVKAALDLHHYSRRDSQVRTEEVVSNLGLRKEVVHFSLSQPWLIQLAAE